MYVNYTRQSLPSEEYLTLLGSAICVFNSNTGFIIENILNNDEDGQYNWYDLIDMECGKLKPIIKTIIDEKCGTSITSLYAELISRRNRIIHSFQITDKHGEQILATKEREKDGGSQYEITINVLKDFINMNQKLSSELHKVRGY